MSHVAQSCLTLCDPMNCSTPGFPVHHQLLELTQTHVHWVDAIQWCHPTISSCVVPFSFCLQSFSASGSFPMSQLFTSGGQSIGVSALTSVISLQLKLKKIFFKWRFLEVRWADICLKDTWTHSHTHISVYTHIHVHICAYMSTHAHTDTHMHTQTQACTHRGSLK